MRARAARATPRPVPACLTGARVRRYPMPQFDLALVLHGQYHDWLVTGLLLSLKLAGTTFVLALPLAIVVALLRLAPNAALRALGTAYVEGIRNVPLRMSSAM